MYAYVYTSRLFRYSPRIFKLYKCKWRTTPILQIDKCDFAKLVEKVLYVLGANVWWQIANINATLIAGTHLVTFSV